MVVDTDERGDGRGMPSEVDGMVLHRLVPVARRRRRIPLLAAAVVAGLILAGCADRPGPVGGAGAAADPAAMRPELEQLAREMLVTGAVVRVVSPELGERTTAIGTQTYRGTDPVRVDDHVRIGSVTKTWTGTVVLQLVDEGRLRLEDPVARYRPDVPNGRNITIEQLLSMRSGLGNYSVDPGLNRRQDAAPAAVYAPEELIAIGLAMPTTFSPPGSGFAYSNTNTALLGRIVEQLTGHPLEVEIRDRVLGRLGMTQSSFPPLASADLPAPRAHGYTYGTNVETMDSNVLPEPVQAAARSGALAPMDKTFANPSWAWAAGAGISTVDDLARYAPALVGGGLLSPDLQRRRIDSVRPIDPSAPQSPGYGLALARFGPFYGHTGELPGYNTFVGYDPQRRITVVVWASLAPAPDGRDPATQMARAVIARLYGSS